MSKSMFHKSLFKIEKIAKMAVFAGALSTAWVPGVGNRPKGEFTKESPETDQFLCWGEDGR